MTYHHFSFSPVKKQIEPRENEIKEKKEQIQNMEGELERFHKTNISLQLEKTTLKQKLKACDSELQMQRQKVRDCRSVIKTFKIELHKCAGKIQDPQELKKAVIQLHAASRGNDNSSGNKDGQDSKIDTSSQEEKAQSLMMRQREHLERSLASLREKMNKDNQVQRNDHIRIMQENVHLIAEINELRKELKLGRVKISDLETALGVRKGKKSNSKNNNMEIIKDDSSKLLEQKNKIEQLEGIVERQATQLTSLRVD